MKFFTNLNLSIKFIAPVLIGTLLSMGAGGYMIFSEVIQGSANQNKIAAKASMVEQEHTRAALNRALDSKAKTIGSFIAKVSPDLILSFDFTSLQAFQAEATKDTDIVYVGYLKPDGKNMVAYKKPKDMSQVREKKFTIFNDKNIIGYIVLGMSTKSIEQGMKAADKRTKTAIGHIERTSENTMSTLMGIIVVTVLLIIAVITGLLIFLFRSKVVSRLRETTALIDELAQGNGDLTVRLPVRSKDEIGQLRFKVNIFIATLHEMIGNIADDAEELTQASDTLTSASADLLNHAETQSSQTNLAATAMNEMTATVQEVARNVNEAAETATLGQTEADTGARIVKNTVTSIHQLSEQVKSAATVITELSERSEKISSVLDVINGIAEQTNLLALNAAIEAARAGDQGRGFAVVADEVRTLASRTHESTLEIREVIEQVLNGTKNAVNVMESGQKAAGNCVDQAEKAGLSLESLNNVVQTINSMTMQIASAAEQQSATADEINTNIEQIFTVSENTMKSSEETANSAAEMSELAKRLNNLVGKFEI